QQDLRGLSRQPVYHHHPVHSHCDGPDRYDRPCGRKRRGCASDFAKRLDEGQRLLLEPRSGLRSALQSFRSAVGIVLRSKLPFHAHAAGMPATGVAVDRALESSCQQERKAAFFEENDRSSFPAESPSPMENAAKPRPERTRLAKTRLDLLLVERGLAQSRERARALVLAGRVLVTEQKGEQKVDKPGVTVS